MQRAARRARRPAAGLPGRPRRRHERQVDDDADSTAALLRAEGLARGRVHVAARRRLARAARHRRRQGFERAIARVRPAAERVGATQFEALTAAALAEFAAAEVDAAVVEAGLGGRLDATNVLRAPVVVLTNVGLEHTELLGETREEIAAREARGRPAGRHGRPLRARVAGARALVRRRATVLTAGATSRSRSPRPRRSSGARSTPAAAEGRPSRAGSSAAGEAPLEICDGAHNLDGVGWLLPRLPDRRYVVVASILATRTPTGCSPRSRRSATRSSRPSRANARALSADELARLAGRWFPRTETEPDPAAALAARASSPDADGAVLVTGSLYLLADLAARRRRRTIQHGTATQRLRLRRDRDRRVVQESRSAWGTSSENCCYDAMISILFADTRPRPHRRPLRRGSTTSSTRDVARDPEPRRSSSSSSSGSRRAYWVYKDARRRIEDPWLVAMATMLGLVRRSSARSSTSSSARRSTSRTCASASSRSGDGGAARRSDAPLPGLPRRRSSRSSSSARSARRS